MVETKLCPYAVALSDEEDSSEIGSPRSSSAKSVAAELSSCPAFQSHSETPNNSNTRLSLECPFKSAKSPEEVQRTLASIPPSHFAQQDTSFLKIMQHLHKVHERGADQDLVESILKPATGGGCPMQSYLNTNKRSFARAMEDCSLAAVMARLAADVAVANDKGAMGGGSMKKSNSNASLIALIQEEQEEEDEEEHTQQPQEDETEAATQPSQPVDNNKSPPASLAQALKAGTAVAHQAAEDVHFVRNFIRGIIDRHLYQQLVLSLYHVYVALEEALDQHASTHFASCHFPEQLARKSSLEEDCEFWHNTRSPSPLTTISPATQEYMDRIRHIAETDPLLLLSHSYTRYLGDLSGGRILARVARKALDLEKDGSGLAFYQFGRIPNHKQFKDAYRRALDELPLTQEQVQKLVAEANVAFCFNMRIFQELDVMATIEGAKVMSLEEVMTFAYNKDQPQPAPTIEEEEQQCPFLVQKKNNEQQQQQPAAVTGKRCPWPFVFAHDPVQGIKDWQTWVLVAIVGWWMCPREQKSNNALLYVIAAVGVAVGLASLKAKTKAPMKHHA